MASYTYPATAVVIQATGGFAIGATGVLYDRAGGVAQQMYDLNDSPIPSITVGQMGAHPDFKADIPYGVLDFGSLQLAAISHEALTAAITIRPDLLALQDRVALIEQNGGGGGGSGATEIFHATSLALAPPATLGGVLIVTPSTI